MPPSSSNKMSSPASPVTGMGVTHMPFSLWVEAGIEIKLLSAGHTASQTSPTMGSGALEKQALEEGRPWVAEEIERVCVGSQGEERVQSHIWRATEDHFACFPILIRVMPAGINMNQSAAIRLLLLNISKVQKIE